MLTDTNTYYCDKRRILGVFLLSTIYHTSRLNASSKVWHEDFA